MRKGIFALAAFVFGGFILYKQLFSVTLVAPQTAGTASYRMAEGKDGTIRVFDSNIPQVSHIEMTPDGNTMLVGTLPGVIFVYHKKNGGWLRQEEPFFTVATSQPGFPPEEAGLTGIALGADFETSGDVFLLYSFAKEKKSFRNRVMRLTYTKRGQRITGTNPKDIYEASTPGAGSHQIQDGVGVFVTGHPHLLFVIGEGFVGKRAPDPAEEAGKLMLIDREGNNPEGTRPYPQFPKIQATGLRNPPALTKNPLNGFIAIGDTGPSSFDRFIYGKMFEENGENNGQLAFGWDGTDGSLQKKVQRVYEDSSGDMVLHRWDPTETPVNIAFFEHPTLPTLLPNQQYVLISLFGRTGEKMNTPGKMIALGTLTNDDTPDLSFIPLVVRTPESEGQLGHPIGLAIDPVSREFFFGDIMEGRMYRGEL